MVDVRSSLFLLEREERRQKLKRENQNEGSHRYSEPVINDYMAQSRNTRQHGRVNNPPQGWVDCSSYGQCIGNIIPSKVPLDETYNDCVRDGKRYSPEQVINEQILTSSLWMEDKPSEWKAQCIKYVKALIKQPTCCQQVVVDVLMIVTITGMELCKLLRKVSDAQTTMLGVCTYPGSPALALGLIAAVAFMRVQAIINSVSGCTCCKKHPNSSDTNWTIGLISFMASWVNLSNSLGSVVSCCFKRSMGTGKDVLRRTLLHRRALGIFRKEDAALEFTRRSRHRIGSSSCSTSYSGHPNICAQDL